MRQTPGESSKLKLVAVGDIMPNRDEPESIFELTAQALKEYDIRFGQLEINFSERGARPTGEMGGAGRSHPRNVRALTCAGMDVVSYASNHCLDWGPDALLDTLDVVRKEGIEVVGAGKDIVEARKPVIMERKGIKVAFLAYNSILPNGFWADVGKPGCAPLRARTLYEMSEHGQPGCPPNIFTYPYKEDLEAMLADIRQAKAKADVLILSLHWGLHFVRAKLATYQQEVGHAALDAGADIIIGSHPHILKGIEVYKGKVIFYSLCNFALDSGFRRPVKEGAVFIRAGHVIDPAWVRTYPFPAESRKTIAAVCEISGKRIEKVSFLPTLINIKAQPRILRHEESDFDDVVKYVEAITKEAGLNGRYTVEGDEIVVS